MAQYRVEPKTAPDRYLLTTFVSGLLILAGLALLILLSYSAWQLERRWNYSWSYKAMVQQTVHDMVKAEALK